MADVPITVLRASDGKEIIPADEEFTMETGDSAIFPPNVAGKVHNDGNEDASMLVTNIFPHEGSEGATPEAGTPEV